jgi:hypothetical protein
MARPGTFYQPAVEVLFPAGVQPWASQPLKVQPGSDYFTPGTVLPAENLNYHLYELGGGTNSLAAYVAQQDGINWGSALDMYSTLGSGLEQVHSTNYYNQLAVVFDSYSGVWLAYSTANGVESFWYSADAVTWTALITSGANSGSTWTGAAISNGAGVVVYLSNLGVNCYNAIAGMNVVASGTYGIFGTYFNNTFVTWNSTNSFYSATGTSGWTSGATFGFSVTGQHCVNTVNGTPTLLLMPSATNPTNYLLSTNGTTFTSTSFGVSFDSGSTIVGASYDASAGLYVVVTSTGSSSKVYTSPSAAASTWTLVSTISHACGQLLCTGTEWLLSATSKVSFPSPATSQTIYRLLISIDQGATWRFTRLTGLSTSTSYSQTTSGIATGVKLVSGGGRLLLWCNNPTSSSGAGNGSYWVSDSIGLPPALTF